MESASGSDIEVSVISLPPYDEAAAATSVAQYQQPPPSYRTAVGIHAKPPAYWSAQKGTSSSCELRLRTETFTERRDNHVLCRSPRPQQREPLEPLGSNSAGLIWRISALPQGQDVSYIRRTEHVNLTALIRQRTPPTNTVASEVPADESGLCLVFLPLAFAAWITCTIALTLHCKFAHYPYGCICCRMLQQAWPAMLMSRLTHL